MILAAAAAAAIFFLSAAAFLLRSAYEKRQLVTEKYDISAPGLKGRVRIAFISDVHNRVGEESAGLIEEKIRESKPDAVFLGGDIVTVTRDKDTPPDIASCERLISRLSKLCPVFYGEGNHELKLRENYPGLFNEYMEYLAASDCLYLNNAKAGFNGLSIYGISLDEDYYRKNVFGIGRRVTKKRMPADYMLKRLGMPDKDGFNVLLMHSPLYLAEAADWGADLVLSGHFHGGTVRLPYLGGLMTPQLGFFSGECSGLHKKDGTCMIVTRGIGTHSVNIRINDLPEISIIDISGDGGNVQGA